MRAYFDFSFLPLLVFKNARRQWAWDLVHGGNEGHPINHLHLLQMENLFVRTQLQGTEPQRRAGVEGAGLWRFYRDNLVFVLSDPPWLDVFRTALGLHDATRKPVPQPSHFLHAASAAALACTSFVSVHPQARRLARDLGLRLVPEKL